MKKPKYSKEEIRNLFTDLEQIDNDYPEVPTVRSSIVQSQLKSMNNDSDHLFQDPMLFVKIEIESLSDRIKILKKISKTFNATPMKEIPTLINDSNEIVSVIARWRLKRGQ